MVDESVDLFSDRSQSLNPVHINMLKKLVYLSWSVRHLPNQSSEKLNKVWVVVVNAEVEAVEEGHLVFIDVV
jgi:hypothetical protein